MDLTWNLDTIYTSFESEKFINDLEQTNKYIIKIGELKIEDWEYNKNSIVNMEEYIRLNNEYKKIYLKVYSYAFLMMSIDFNNLEAMNILDDIEDRNMQLVGVLIKFSRWLKGVDNLDEIIGASTYLAEHKFYLKELLLKSKFLLGEKEEVIIAKMQNTGAKAWERFYMELISKTKVSVNINGKDENLSLSELRNLAYEKDDSVRKSAYLGEANLCKSISQACANSINAISGETIATCEMRGYKSPLEKVLVSSRMDIETLNVMMKAVKDSLPIFHRYFRKKAELLGHKSKLPFYDIFAPIGDSEIKLTYSKAIRTIETSFETFNTKLAKFSTKVFENRWVDAEPRKDKGNYGLSVDIFPLQESRIITSYHGKYIDIGILAHEIGHAYHSANLYNQTMLNTDYPTPIAETASIFCETILNNELIKAMPIEEAKVILERSISDAAYYIVDFYGRYLFEVELYNRRKTGSLSVEELNDLMVDSMKKAYGDSIDAETIHPYMWMNKVGYFMTDNEFLNFPYSFGVLFSKGLYSEYIIKGETFVKQYDNFLSETSVNNIVDIARILDIDVHSMEFWENSLKLMESDIEKFIRIA